MNTTKLTGVKQNLFLLIAQQPGITRKELCAYSFYRGGQLMRINHHLKGLEQQEFIISFLRKNNKDYHYKISSCKGKKMLEALKS